MTGAAKVTSRITDKTTRPKAAPGARGAFVLPCNKGPLDNPILVDKSNFLYYFTPNDAWEVGMSAMFHEINSYLQAGSAYVQRVAGAGALFSGFVAVRSSATSKNNYPSSVDIDDPSAFNFDTTTSAGVAEESQIVTDSDVADSLNGEYVTIELPGLTPLDAKVKHYFFFKTSGGALSDPSLANATGHQVDIATGAIADVVATALQAAIDGVTGVTASVAGSTITYVNDNPGTVTDSALSSGLTGLWSLIVTTQGIDVDDAEDVLLFVAKDQGTWGDELYIKIFTYEQSPETVKEPGAFIVQVFKNDNPNEAVETLLMSRVQNKVDGYGNALYVDQVSETSPWITVINNTQVLETVYPKEQTVVVNFAGGHNGAAVTEADMMAGWDIYLNKAKYPVKLMMDGGYSTSAVHQRMNTTAKAVDAFAIGAIPLSAEQSASYMTAIADYKSATLIDSRHFGYWLGASKITDLYTGRKVIMGPSGLIGSIISTNATTKGVWFPPAGDDYPLNVEELVRTYTDGELDLLVDMGINPLAFFENEGIYPWGNKTSQVRPSATQEVHVSLMLNEIIPISNNMVKHYLHKLDTPDGRAEAIGALEDYLEVVQTNLGLYDSVVSLDVVKSVNGKWSIDSKIAPTESLKEINLNWILSKTNAEFKIVE